MVEGERAEDRRQRHAGAGSGGMHMGRQGLGKDARVDSQTGKQGSASSEHGERSPESQNWPGGWWWRRGLASRMRAGRQTGAREGGSTLAGANGNWVARRRADVP